MKKIDVMDLETMFLNRDDFVLINVLSGETFNKKHIPMSININVEDENFEKKVGGIVNKKNRKIVVYCASEECDASLKAVTKLEADGYTNVMDFEFGVKGWEEVDNKTISS